MSRIGRFLKDAQDRKRYVVDYDDWLDSDETISMVTVTGTIEEDGFIVDGYVVHADGKKVVYYVSGGLPEAEYSAVITITTSGAQIKEDWIVHVVT